MQLKQPKTIDEMSHVEKMGGTVPASPMSTIEILLRLAENDID